MRVIGVSGYARAGKDTVGDVLAEQGYSRVSFAAIMKETALAINPIVAVEGHRPIYMKEAVVLHGWDVAKQRYTEVRRFLQRLGTEGGRKTLGPALALGENIWVEALIRQLHPRGRYVITDARFENEAKAIVREGGTVWRVTRPGINAINAHISEKSLDDWNFDVRIANNGSLTDLRVAVLANLDQVLRSDTLTHADARPTGNEVQAFPCVDNNGAQKAHRR